MKERKIRTTKQRLMTALLLVLLALAGIGAATFAWMSLSDMTKVSSIGMEVTLGNNLRMDLDSHLNIENYKKTLTFEEIARYVAEQNGYNYDKIAFDPVTTQDYETFTFEDGSVADASTGKYIKFTLHFIAKKDMVVHLTSANSDGSSDGTVFDSSKETLADAMRISFTTDGVTSVYDPGSENVLDSENTPENDEKTEEISNIKIENHTFSLPKSGEMVYNNQNRLFVLKANEDKPVSVCVWMEGTDPACEDSLKNADYSIRLRFTGTDANNEELK